MAFKAYMSPITGWIAEWQYWSSQTSAPSRGELLRRIDVLIREVSAWRAALSREWVDPNLLKELVKVAQYCAVDSGDSFKPELGEIATLEFSEPEGFARFFKTQANGHWTPPDDPEYRRMQSEFDAKLTAEAERFERTLRRAKDKMLGVPATEAVHHPVSVADSASPSLTAQEYRAQLVAQVIRELNLLKPQLFVPSDYARLKAEHPGYLTFEVTEANSDIRTLLMSIQAHRQHTRLAIQIVAARTGKALETIKIDWAKFKPPEFRRKQNLRT